LNSKTHSCTRSRASFK